MKEALAYAPLLKSSFDNFFQAPIEVWMEFAAQCDVVSYQKDEVVKPHDTTERYFYFIITGSLGIFLWKEKNYVCLDFAFDGHFCSDYMSMLTRQSTPLEVVALENTSMLRMTTDNYDYLTKQKVPIQTADGEHISVQPDGMFLRLVAAEMTYIGKQQQQIDLLTKSAGQRYEILLSQFPDIHNRIAQNHIASYLGITPQSLSRIRRRIK